MDYVIKFDRKIYYYDVECGCTVIFLGFGHNGPIFQECGNERNEQEHYWDIRDVRMIYLTSSVADIREYSDKWNELSIQEQVDIDVTNKDIRKYLHDKTNEWIKMYEDTRNVGMNYYVEKLINIIRNKNYDDCLDEIIDLCNYVFIRDSGVINKDNICKVKNACDNVKIYPGKMNVFGWITCILEINGDTFIEFGSQSVK